MPSTYNLRFNVLCVCVNVNKNRNPIGSAVFSVFNNFFLSFLSSTNIVLAFRRFSFIKCQMQNVRILFLFDFGTFQNQVNEIIDLIDNLCLYMCVFQFFFLVGKCVRIFCESVWVRNFSIEPQNCLFR